MELASGKDIEPVLREQLVRQIGQMKFDRWFADVTFSRRGEEFVVEVSSPFQKDWLQKNYRHEISRCFRELFGKDVSFQFLVDSAPARRAPSEADDLTLRPDAIEFKKGTGSDELLSFVRVRGTDHPSKPAARRRAERPAGRTFASYETFVTGISNSAAKGIADIAISRPGLLNPILIYGPSSVGKTHLLEGIYSEFRKVPGRKSPKYLTSDEFTGQFVRGFQEKPGGDRTLRNRLGDSNLVVIEDIQNFEKRDATQRELSSLVDLLRAKGVQIIMSADRSLAEMTFLKPELRTRLESGVVCAIEPPDRETLLRVFRQMAEKRNLNIPDEIARFVVSRFATHARQLSGALNLLHAAFLTGGDISTLESVSAILGAMAPCRQMPVTLEDIENAVASVFGITAKDLQGRSRSRQCSYPRMLAMWLARRYTHSALSEIGRHFGGRSHSTVAAAQKKIDLWLEKGEKNDFSDALLRVEQILSSRGR